MGRCKRQKITSGSRGEHAQATRRTNVRDARRHIAVRIDYCGLTRLQQSLEQAQLGGQIGDEVWMIVEMVAREVGEGGRAQSHAIQPALIQSVRRGFHRQMRHAVMSKTVERLVQRDGIGRCQRTIGLTIWRYDASRAKRRCAQPKLGPDLPGESGDGCLAACASDRDDGGWLCSVKARSRRRQGGAHIGDRKNWRPMQRLGRGMIGDDSDGAGANGGLSIAQAISARARHGEKHEAGLHGATIGRQACNFTHRHIGGRLSVRNKLAQAEHQFPLEGVLT